MVPVLDMGAVGVAGEDGSGCPPPLVKRLRSSPSRPPALSVSARRGEGAGALLVPAPLAARRRRTATPTAASTKTMKAMPINGLPALLGVLVGWPARATTTGVSMRPTLPGPGRRPTHPTSLSAVGGKVGAMTLACPKDLPELVSALDAGAALSCRAFYGHRPRAGGGVDDACLSQWWQGSPFVVARASFATAEHWMMASKARMFGDASSEARILASSGPAEAKRLGRSVRGFDEALWARTSSRLVYVGNLAKFSSHPALASFLLSTGDSVLVEASPTDRVWGVGLSRSDPRCHDPRLWRGENRLGFALARVRETLRVLGCSPGHISPGVGALVDNLASADPLAEVLLEARSGA